MKYLLTLCLSLIVASPAFAKPVSAEAFARAVAHIGAVVEASRKVPRASPGLAVIAVREGSSPVLMVSGVADVRTGAKANGDTPFYIASMTKAYVGLLAVKLDRKDVLDLDSRLSDHWPDLRIEGVNTNGMTLRNLLGHRMLFTNEVLTHRTAYTDEVPVAEYPALLAAPSKPKPPGFAYDNLGYLLYGAILEKKTGRSWKDWLAREILMPMGLKHSSTRGSDFPVVAAAHQWNGSSWDVMPMKTDPVMHAAGGMVTSPRDMAHWLMAHVKGHAPEIPARLFRTARSATSYTESEDDLQRVCDGYAMGWNRCRAQGLTVLEHGGGYTGFRSWMMIAPEQKIGFAVLTNSDSMTGWLSENLMMEFLKPIADPDAEPADPTTFAAEYVGRVRQLAEKRRKPKPTN